MVKQSDSGKAPWPNKWILHSANSLPFPHGDLYLLCGLNMVAWLKINSRIKSQFRGGEEDVAERWKHLGTTSWDSHPFLRLETLKGSWEEWFPLSQNVPDLCIYSIHSLPLLLLRNFSWASYFPCLQSNSNLLWRPTVSVMWFNLLELWCALSPLPRETHRNFLWASLRELLAHNRFV